MKLRLGQPVHSTDGPFGVLAEIVVNPEHKKVTHIIVEPALGYYQSRLVPIWLVESTDSIIQVQLDEAHVRQLQRVGYSDFVHHDDIISIDDEWDVGTEDIVSLATNKAGDDLPILMDALDEYRRIPEGECEILVTSRVISSDGFGVGTVHGFLSDESDSLSAIIVRVGVLGLRHDVLVGFDDISRVLHRRIDLKITESEFFGLPHTGSLTEDNEAASTVNSLKQRLLTFMARSSVQGERLVQRAASRVTAAMDNR